MTSVDRHQAARCWPVSRGVRDTRILFTMVACGQVGDGGGGIVVRETTTLAIPGIADILASLAPRALAITNLAAGGRVATHCSMHMPLNE